jgi:predicted GNAT family acetyltransferase
MDKSSEIKENVRAIGDASWVIEHKGAVCKFECTSSEDAVIYDCEVPEDIRGRGIGTNMIRVAEEKIRQDTEAKFLYAQIGEENGATRHILENKLDFEVINVENRETLGKVVDAQKFL